MRRIKLITYIRRAIESSSNSSGTV